MKPMHWLSAFALSLFLGCFLLLSPGMSYGQDDQPKSTQPNEAKPAQPETRPEATKPDQDEPARRQDETKPSQPNNNDDKASRDQDTMKQDDNKRPDGKQDEKQNAVPAPSNGQANRASGSSNQASRIPDDKFKSNFGRQHTFAIQQPTVVQGQSRFQYGGYSFNFQSAWPTGWAYTDQFYVDFIDGEYFLFDLAHPGVRLAIIVVM